MANCRSTKNNGEPCTNPAHLGSKYCWHHRDSSAAFWLQSVIIAAVSILIGFLLAVAYESKQAKHRVQKESTQRKKNTPIPNVEVSQVGTNALKIVVQSGKSESSVIDNLFFTIDIPGTFAGLKDKDLRDVSGLTATSIWQFKSSGVVAAERLNINCEKLYPQGYASCLVFFSPPKETVQVLGSNQYTNKPAFSDLRDFVWVNYFWEFMGETIKESYSMNLRHLPIIIEDNENLIKAFRNEEFHKSTGTPLRPHELKWDDEYVLKMERKRAGLP